MAMGTATLDFGAGGGQYATYDVTGQVSITTGADVEAFFMGDSTADHGAFAHETVLPLSIRLTCSVPTTAVGFTIHAISNVTIFGQVAVRWVWSD